MAISGQEVIAPIFNGSIISMHIEGDPVGGDPSGFRYEGLAFLTWNPKHECYDQFWLNNMDETATTELRWVDDRNLVATHSGVQFGKPEASRATLELNEKGAIKKTSMDRLNSTNAVVRAFHGTYTKKEPVKKIQK